MVLEPSFSASLYLFPKQFLLSSAYETFSGRPRGWLRGGIRIFTTFILHTAFQRRVGDKEEAYLRSVQEEKLHISANEAEIR